MLGQMVCEVKTNADDHLPTSRCHHCPLKWVESFRSQLGELGVVGRRDRLGELDDANVAAHPLLQRNQRNIARVNGPGLRTNDSASFSRFLLGVSSCSLDSFQCQTYQTADSNNDV